MQLTLHADYALRVLIYLADQPQQYAPTREISHAYGISWHHLVRVVRSLQRHGFVESLEGRKGGVRLARDPASIRLGQVVYAVEPNFQLVECFDAETNACVIAPGCQLQSVLHKALRAFFTVLDEYTLADVSKGPRGKSLRSFMQVVQPVSRAARGR